jgi:putative nucleotidyltransferase with HDIG domain
MTPVEVVRQALSGADAWIVGGTVRDQLLGRPLRDVDVAVSGDPASAARAVAQAIGGPVFRLSEAFGAWRAIDPAAGVVYDFSPLQGATIEEDLAQRDFTVNAMARPLATEELVDPHGGRTDLEERVLRVLGPRAYAEDPLRPLRLARFAAELSFSPDPKTEQLTREAAPRVPEASPERIYAELRRLLIADGALEGVTLSDRLGVLAAVLPEVSALHGVEQSHFHHLDVYHHTLEVLGRQIELEARLEEIFEDNGEAVQTVLDEELADELTRAQALRFGALLHDIGKPPTRSIRPDGRVTFIGHDALGEQMVRAVCRRLRTSERFSHFVEGLTRHHLMLGFMVHARPLEREHVYRYLKATSSVEVEVTLLSCADRLATRGKNAEAAIAAHLELARELMAAALEWRRSGPPRPPLRGNELAAELGMEPGPELGELLARLEEAVFTGEATTRQQAVELARRLRHNPSR